jgi:hypothetical protein
MRIREFKQAVTVSHRPGRRTGRSSRSLRPTTPRMLQPANMLTEFFKGPGTTEKYTYVRIAVYSGTTSYSKLEIADDITHVYLKGKWYSQGGTYTIANLSRAKLKQFSYIQYVKIYDQMG